jgi:serine/threonine protein kinase
MDREDRIHELQQALAKLDQTRWVSFLEAACPEDASLRVEVLRRQRALVKEASEDRPFTSHGDEEGAQVPDSTTLANYFKSAIRSALGSQSVAQLARPTAIGPYRVLSLLGEGGMGVVYLAEQEQPIRRRVAVKVVKVGMDSREVLTRFASERQALALMTHPNIAKVLDAGWSEDGRPFFVMEYVAGIPITQYCDQQHLPMRARLELFRTVCEALHHAHQKGVLHRDIKPSNILVSVEDGHAVPHIIDFGVAKALNQRLAEETVFTQFGLLVGTPEYMSPEQAEMSPLGVDTTSDVYSLGVLLYELLVGALPFDSNFLRKAGYAEIQRIIREEEPPRPSTRLSGLGATASEVAKQRQTDVSALTRALRGDLDWITLKAMDKNRTRRYASASELAADVWRHLEMEPVLARPPSLMYRAGKFGRKHKVALMVMVVGVTASTVVSTAIQTRLAAQTTARREVLQVQFIEGGLQFLIGSALRRNPATPWTEALLDDYAFRSAVDGASLASPGSVVAICDMNGRVVLAANTSKSVCPSGRPLPEIASVGVVDVLTNSRLDEFVSSHTLVEDGNVIETRVKLSGDLLRLDFLGVLIPTVFFGVLQLLAVGVVATIASWFIFRRN